MRRDVPLSTVTWSDDGRTITKRQRDFFRDEIMGTAKSAFTNEQRVNRMLAVDPPPVRAAHFLGMHRKTMSFVAVEGRPLGPKFPEELGPQDVGDLIDLVGALGTYGPKRRWFRRFSVSRRLDVHLSEGLLTEAQAELIRRRAEQAKLRYRFAHGDVMARNVLRDNEGRLTLIDWEWAGLYPQAYESAFLWFTLIDVPGGRSAVEKAVADRQRLAFIVSATLIQLLHLHLWRERLLEPFRVRNLATLKNLLDALA